MPTSEEIKIATDIKKAQKKDYDWPPHLKDPKNYDKIQRALLDTLATPHSHSELIEYTNCFDCQSGVREHAELMRKLGFTSPAMYKDWQKRHSTIQSLYKQFPHLEKAR